MNNGIKKSDWELFIKLLPMWQENYMERLNKEYIHILSQDQLASKNFWELEKRIKIDKKNPGVILQLEKSELEITLLSLIKNKVITFDDLQDFSDELKNTIQFYLK